MDHANFKIGFKNSQLGAKSQYLSHSIRDCSHCHTLSVRRLSRSQSRFRLSPSSVSPFFIFDDDNDRTEICSSHPSYTTMKISPKYVVQLKVPKDTFEILIEQRNIDVKTICESGSEKLKAVNMN
ncbi:hypothetical protein HYC85_019443 [Camellia sinensis]|uniref:Uncharacterized protein n=1 Tax=Camellia sinensis TaxID=4442 RepID=A0A7J7GPG1_CAMSI|nr:hypothetical protein HYC85_019443 [Camellia sinensis]